MLKKKVIMIDHSYHKKTGSSSFFSKILDEKYKVEIIYDESWEKGSNTELDLKFIDDRYEAVIFFQSINTNMLRQVKCKNIIYVPMYDAIKDFDLDYWYDYKDIKILSFSKTLYDYLKPYGFNVMLVQYFPKAANEFKIIEEKKVFFWARIHEINWNIVKNLIKEMNVESVHIHKAIDPEQGFIFPSIEDEKMFNIKYSDWFKTKEEYFECLKKNSIYIAPRLYEGIGFSFLEAMSMGKIVIGIDNPMMNEYIENNKNGFLFSINNIKSIHIKDIKELQINSYITIVEGRKKWEASIPYMLDFIGSVKTVRKNDNKLLRRKIIFIIIKKWIKKIIKCVIPYGIVRAYERYYKSIC
ncbi:glycosyltransferase [Clostridium beijerinckii]|uniref:Glycosyl transferases group 1 n=1 Tax=Clostridium beijerinckii TaxID=1520 RepID=A0A1S8SAV8_CLOBE|nr:glycosyltransferase [Clostridium beijerinckii]NRY60536.1 glycosyltransferase involved in cell wall biosynthesis [Clostridium beijerinckii]OOM62593.1 glycosyl transferases group 1 [Clostridium beijerinckii]